MFLPANQQTDVHNSAQMTGEQAAYGPASNDAY
jgi:hypothetical protein